AQCPAKTSPNPADPPVITTTLSRQKVTSHLPAATVRQFQTIAGYRVLAKPSYHARARFR
ncbi:MAG: hypothetical protein ACK53V_18095, partial [Planctomycetota bacterium]